MNNLDRYTCLLSYVRGAYDLAKLPDFPKGPDRDPERVLISELIAERFEGLTLDTILKHPRYEEICKSMDLKQFGLTWWNIEDGFFELVYMATKDNDLFTLKEKLIAICDLFFETERKIEGRENSIVASFDTLSTALRNDAIFYNKWRSTISLSIIKVFNTYGYVFPDLENLSGCSAELFLSELISQGEK